MSKYTTETLRSVALVGHGAAGKTSLAEALLFATGTIPAKGSVDKGNTVADFDPQEKEAGHSLTSAVVNFGYEDTHIHLIDTPGYPDFSGQAIAALAGVDTALIVVNAQTGVGRRFEQRAMARLGFLQFGRSFGNTVGETGIRLLQCSVGPLPAAAEAQRDADAEQGRNEQD